MTDDMHDTRHDLGAWFAELRPARAAGPRAFHTLVEAARVRQGQLHAIRRRRLRIALAAILLTAAGVGTHARLRDPDARRAAELAAELAALSHWRAPTDVLLEGSQLELLYATPTIRSPMIDDTFQP